MHLCSWPGLSSRHSAPSKFAELKHTSAAEPANCCRTSASPSTGRGPEAELGHWPPFINQTSQPPAGRCGTVTAFRSEEREVCANLWEVSVKKGEGVLLPRPSPRGLKSWPGSWCGGGQAGLPGPHGTGEEESRPSALGMSHQLGPSRHQVFVRLRHLYFI